MGTKIATKPRKIIHIDMDCFFAAIEIRDNPSLSGKPVAVGGTIDERGVLATCNYEARRYGLHSAMPTVQAFKLCSNLVLLPVRREKYWAVSKQLKRIFEQYTSLVEMRSLDEAFLDVTDCSCCNGSATFIAQEIKWRIKNELNLTASAGAAPNKFLAKVASDWKKPNGMFVITPNQISDFVKKLPVNALFGVGKVTARKLYEMKIKTCADLQMISLEQLSNQFGKMGIWFYHLCRGLDDRPVEPERIRKTLSVEKTFPRDLKVVDLCLEELVTLTKELHARLLHMSYLIISKQFIKIKFGDFKQTTVEMVTDKLNDAMFFSLLHEGLKRYNKPVRLLGVGVRFRHNS